MAVDISQSDAGVIASASDAAAAAAAASGTDEVNDGNTDGNGQRQRQQQQQQQQQQQPKEDEPPSKRKLKRIAKAKANEGWRKEVQDFKDACLDDSYIFYAVRNTLIQGAKQFPPSKANTKTLLPGTHKHLGGAYDPVSGTVFGIPANGGSIMTISPNPQKGGSGGEYELGTIPLPAHIARRQMKWLRGIVEGKYLWAIPSWANAVLCVDLEAWREVKGQQRKQRQLEEEAEIELQKLKKSDVVECNPDQENSTGDETETKNQKKNNKKKKKKNSIKDMYEDVVKLIPLPESHPDEMRWQWHGGAFNDDKTAIYCVPSNAGHVLKINVTTMTTSFIDIEFDQEEYPDFTLDCTNKWYGGIPGDDNCIYGSPYRAAGVLRIDCKTDTAKIIGPNYGVGKYFWHGGIKRNGKIYAHPSHANTVLVIETNDYENPTVSEIPIHRADYDKDTSERTYKWLGGAVGADGHIYCPACDTSAVLKIDVDTDHVTTFGLTTFDKNKWQGGIMSPRDNCIYCIPADGTKVLRIATDPSIQGENPVQLLGDLPDQKDKWQGAAIGLDGTLYFIPENGYRVLKVTPPEAPPEIVDRKLPEGDVKIELM
eukprot:CAMPEP_0113511318 /NCGR_PEP_ID=MMETSP0014_2-20120614/38646_1 /TAXON_ID=2857 /ORGANISM="Nitzschia sp." /LENGTH=596 /DNA_ID=CAMNT_0000407409 /DNA_START=236 /DNA_END=2026 /DNA_ORIENTATION=+ /assembly_acc=CAM_ASM_000159